MCGALSTIVCAIGPCSVFLHPVGLASGYEEYFISASVGDTA